jgi:glycosyltransferase involved in cell wall biosynthesis
MQEWALRDPRIKLYRSEKQLGLARSSNAVTTKARAPIIARMDADDIAHPQRLERQWKIISTRRDVAVIGTLYNGIDASGKEVRPRDRWRLLRRSRYIPFPHGSAMFRREVFDLVGGYDEAAEGGEDQDLFSKMAAAIAITPATPRSSTEFGELAISSLKTAMLRLRSTCLAR